MSPEDRQRWLNSVAWYIWTSVGMVACILIGMVH